MYLEWNTAEGSQVINQVKLPGTLHDGFNTLHNFQVHK